jgi:hypothetical protein
VECGVTLYHLFVEFKSAYDTVNREQLYLEMRELEIPDKLIRMIKLTILNAILEYSQICQFQ